MSRQFKLPDLTPEQQEVADASRRAEMILMDHFSALCVRAGLVPKRTSVAGIAVYDLSGQHDDIPNLKIELLGLIHCSWGVVEAIRLDRADWSNNMEVDLADQDYHTKLLRFLGVKQERLDECRRFNTFDGLGQ